MWQLCNTRIEADFSSARKNNAMKTIIPTNWNRRRHVLCTLLLGITALCGSARAQQLYVSFGPTINSGSVAQYDASGTTGVLLNPNLIPSLGSQPIGAGLALSGNDLFVSSSILGTVGSYTTSGATNNASLITGLGAAPSPPALAVSGNTLWVANQSPISSSVGSYTTTGIALNATETGTDTTPTGTAAVTFPEQFSQIPSVTVSPLVPPTATGTVSNQTTTGFSVTGFPPNASFGWTARGGTGGIALSSAIPTALTASGNTLFVASNNAIGEYDATTGAVKNASAITVGLNAPAGLAVSGNNLFVSNSGSGTVTEYSLNSDNTGTFVANIITGLSGPEGLAISGNDLFVASEGSGIGSGTVGEYNLTTTTFNPNFIMGLSAPFGLAVTPVPEPSAWSMIALGGVGLLGIMLVGKTHRTA